MTMQAPAPQAHAAPPPGAPAAPPPPAPPAPGAATGAGPVAALQQAMTKLQAVLAGAQAAGGALPPTAAGEVAAIVQMLQGVAGGGAPAPAAAAPPPGPPKPPAPPGAGGPPPGVGKNDGVQKMELDDYTAMKVTLDAARERMWCVSDAMRENEFDKAKTELKGVISMLSALKTDAAKGITTVEMNKAGFANWTTAQFEAMKTDEETIAVERLATVKRVTAIAKASWEQSGGDGTKPFSVEMATAFAPEKEKTMDITAKDDQTSKETPAAKDTPDAKGSFATNLSEVIKDVQSALTVTKQPENGSTVAFSNPNAPAQDPTSSTQKNDGAQKPVEKSDEPFVWPLDMNNPNGGEKFNEEPPAAKRPTESEDGWGKDPWASK